tara:strand:+ start:1300 stop:1590 length:291 start_codon:yes stop_codon:yes gene_type:complete
MTNVAKRATENRKSRGNKGNTKSAAKDTPVQKKIVENSEEFAPRLSTEERQERIAAVAHCRAQKRNFNNGSALQDWLEAESEINEKFPVEQPESSI